VSSVSSATGADLDHGAYQQYVLVGTSAYLTAKLPENITDDEGATLPTAINTAQVALFDSDGFGFPTFFEDPSFGKGKSILVAGGSSAIGLAGTHPHHKTSQVNMNSTPIPQIIGIREYHYNSK
jgi:NADPH:quinone reductase-like Zn-dependent oxidoreductase